MPGLVGCSYRCYLGIVINVRDWEPIDRMSWAIYDMYRKSREQGYRATQACDPGSRKLVKRYTQRRKSSTAGLISPLSR